MSSRGRPRGEKHAHLDLLILMAADHLYRDSYCTLDPMAAIGQAVDAALTANATLGNVAIGSSRKQIIRRVRDRLKPARFKIYTKRATPQQILSPPRQAKTAAKVQVTVATYSRGLENLSIAKAFEQLEKYASMRRRARKRKLKRQVRI